MQSRDESENIKQSVPVDLSNLKDLVEKIESAEKKGAVSHTIGNLPTKDTNLTINGLSYKVEFADFVRGKFTLKLILRNK